MSSTASLTAKVMYLDVEEIPEEVSATVSGQIPPWLRGTLIRNGPGKFNIGKDKLRHWFDGLALLHRFSIADGQVSYYNKFLRSEAYVQGMEQQRVMKNEFATCASPDPCKSLFARFFSFFYDDSADITDNCLVNVIPIKGNQYTATETNTMVQIDPNTLEVLGRVDITKEFPGEIRLFSATAHPHVEEDGTVYNLAMKYGKETSYNIIRVPPSSGAEGEKPLDGGTLVASIPPSTWKPAYFHSFGMTENYFIISENPLRMNPLLLMSMKLTGYSFYDCLSWNPNMKSNFHVVDRKTGEIVNTFVPNDPTFIFHHVNAFERDGHIVMDACCYPDVNIIQELLMENLLAADDSPNKHECSKPELRRYTFPIRKTDDPSRNGTPESQGGADGSDYEVLHPFMELPRIHYEKYNTKRYQFAYGLSATTPTSNMIVSFNLLVKVNVETKETKTWSEEHCYPSEPVFVAAPEAKTEDEGVVLSAVLNVDTKTSFLLVLDAATFEEMARAEIPVRMPQNVHGVFLQS